MKTARPRIWPVVLILLGLFGLTQAAAQAEESLKPFVVSAISGSSVTETVDTVLGKLEAAGLEVVGRYTPYDDQSAVIIGITSPELKKASGRHDTGGFGAVVRIAITNNNGKIEVSYTNPTYLGHAYDIGDLSAFSETLRVALEGQTAFGAKGLSAEKLATYHYMMFMPYFKDHRVAGKFDSHDQAVSAVSQAFTDPESDMDAIWMVKVSPDQTLFGVRLHGGKWEGAMKGIMDKIDTATPKSTAALPWELLISGKELLYLPGRYRIALMFPDLTMGQFMTIAEIPTQMDESAAELMEIATRH